VTGGAAGPGGAPRDGAPGAAVAPQAGAPLKSALFEPTAIRSMTLPNRFVRSATWEGMADDEGRPTPALARLYTDLARGRVGLVVTSHAFVAAEGKAVHQQLGVHDDAMIAPLRDLADAVHAAGGKTALQLAHGGLWSVVSAPNGAGTGAGAACAAQPPGPSVRDTDAGPVGREMTLADIEAVVQAFGGAARRAQAAGYDAVQIHAAHGYLLSEFLSPLFNKRKDAYGGSLAGRARLAVEVTAAVRATVGPDYPVLVKMNSEDFVPSGMTTDDMLGTAALLAAAGADAIELSGGTSLSGDLGPLRTRSGIPQDREAYYQDAALKLKQRVKVRVMLVGGIRTFEAAERLVADGYADYVALSRPLVCEPGLVARWESGDRGPSICRSDNRCFYKGLKAEGMYCPHVAASAPGAGTQ
jgi:2,4-dienoyl-CoA reductase-like NADH-dependent reductase (Old Yellow Enzyme family)